MHQCHSCEVVNFNGVRTHEHGRPDAWRDEIRKCAECGSEFEPEDSHQTYCDHACFCAAYGIRDDEGEESHEDEEQPEGDYYIDFPEQRVGFVHDYASDEEMESEKRRAGL